MSNTDSTSIHRNTHRKDKTSFQAMLTPEEKALLVYVKEKRGIDKDKAVLLTLLNEEKERLNLK